MIRQELFDFRFCNNVASGDEKSMRWPGLRSAEDNGDTIFDEEYQYCGRCSIPCAIGGRSTVAQIELIASGQV
jgi:hypothetical protein